MKTDKFKNILKWLCTAVGAIVLTFACFGCATAADEPNNVPDGSSQATETPKDNETPEEGELPDWANNFDLPDAEEALEKLNGIYGGADKVFLLQNGRIARMPCPAGEVIKLNMTYEAGEYAKLVFEDSVDEFNEVFAVINPHYKFEINYSPTDEDFAEKYSVKMSISDNLAVTETSQVFGLAHISYYSNFTELGDFGITIKSEVLNNGSYLMTTFKHELMHLLGAGDAYKNANATKATVMQSYTVNGYHHLSETDLAFLDTLYRNPALDAVNEKILAYIDAYEETTAHTKANLTATVYNMLTDSLEVEDVKTQADAIGYRDLAEFYEIIKGGINRDTSFGNSNISFKEIEYAKKPTETYFGSIDVKNGLYWHGTQTTSGSSQGIKYTDYGNGILYSAPNGNKHTFIIKTGEYVLSFRLHGSFTNFAELSLELWHISK